MLKNIKRKNFLISSGLALIFIALVLTVIVVINANEDDIHDVTNNTTNNTAISQTNAVSDDLTVTQTQTSSQIHTMTLDSLSDSNTNLNKTTFAPPPVKAGDETLEVHFIDVGEADAILVMTDGYNMLIDAGESETENDLAKYLQNLGIDTIHYLIATHPDRDHIGGMEHIIKNFKIREFYMNDTYKDSKLYDNLISAVRRKGLVINVPRPGIENDKFDLGQAHCQILAPLAKYSSSESNNSSIVIRMTFGEKVFLFAADAEKLATEDIIERYEDLKADVLKVPHHGRSSVTKDFITSVTPKYSVITCLKENIKNSTIKKLQNVGSEIYVTGVDGNIVCVTDGYTIQFY